MPVEISSLATPYIQCAVSPPPLAPPIDPTSYTVEMAFIQGPDDPETGDWKTGSWAVTVLGGYLAQCLIGPDGGTITLPVGPWNVWVKILAGAETIVENTGQIQIT